MTNLYNDLCERWRRAFVEIDKLAAYKAAGQTIRYADNFRFPLSGFTPDDFPAGGPLTMERTSSTITAYYLDTAGRPVFVSFGNPQERYYQWQGFYSYSPDLVEYIEFNLATGNPSDLERIVYGNGKKMNYQRLSLSSKGTNTVSVDDLRDEIMARTIAIEEYSYDGDRMAEVDCLYSGSGIDLLQYKKAYSYLDTGELDTIQSIYEHGRTKLIYVRPDPNFNEEHAVDDLAARLAALIIDTLVANNVQQPVALLNLSYRTIRSWIPTINPTSQADKAVVLENRRGKDVFGHLFIPPNYNDIDLDITRIERAWKQFFDYVERERRSNPGEQMLRKTARLLTLGKLDGKLAVADEFVAYALDGEFEINQLPRVLLECGLPETTLQEWKEKKWFD
jgi:hypothetical protein